MPAIVQLSDIPRKSAMEDTTNPQDGTMGSRPLLQDRQRDDITKLEQRLRSLIEQTTDAVFCYEYDPPIPIDLPLSEQIELLYQGVLVECNEVCAQSYGASRPEEVIGKSLTELFGTTTGSLDRLFMAMIEGGYHIIDGEGVEKRPDGSERYYLNNGHGVIEDGKLERIWGTFRDITVRKRAENALKDNEQKYRQLTEEISDWIWEVDVHGVYTYASPKVHDLLGYTPQDVLGKTPFALMPPDERERVGQMFKDIISSKQAFHGLENICLHANGHEVVMETSGSPIFNDKNELAGYRGIDRDITDRIRAQQALVESEQHHRALIENMPTVCWETDRYGNTTFISANVEQVYGYPPSDIYTKGLELWFERIHLDDRKRVEDSFAQLFTTGTAYDIEYRIQRRDGQWIWLHDKSGQVYEKNGIHYACGAFLDITDRKQAEDGLRHTHEKLEERVRERTAELKQVNRTLQTEITERKLAEDQLVVFRKFSEASEQALGMADLEGNITYANPTLCRLLGAPRPEAICGTNVANYYLEQDLPTLQNNILPAVIEQGHQEVEMPLVSVDGKATDLIQSIFLIRDDQGNPFRIANVITDITERKRAEEELERNRDHLEDMVAERTKDLAENQEKLRSLASELSLTEERQRRKIATWLHDNACQNLALSKMRLQVLSASVESSHRQAVDDITDMIDQILLSMRNLTMDLSPPTLYMFGLEAALEELLQDLLVSKHGIDVKLHGSENAINISEDLCILLYQSVRELIINIVKYAQATEVTVDIEAQSSDITITVKDDGIGFDKNRIETSRASGFGLFNIRERLKSVGGRLEIQSNPGQGTLVTLISPIDGKD